MLFLQFWFALLAFNCPGSAPEVIATEQNNANQKVSEELQGFNRAVEQAGPELKDLLSSFGGLQKEKTRVRRHTIDDMVSFAAQSSGGGAKEDGDKDVRVWQKEADDWYRDIQARMTKNGGKQKRSEDKPERSAKDSSAFQKEADAWYRDLQAHKVKGVVTQKRSGESPNQDEPKKAQDGLAEKLHESRDAPVTESTASRLASPHAKSNKLDHEANYKLSKLEQDASEKLPKFARSGGQEKGHFKKEKRSYTGGFDPMEEVRLKTSARLIAKGFGPLLPSETYDLNRGKKLGDWQAPMLGSGLSHHEIQVHNMIMKNSEPVTDSYEFMQSKDPAVEAVDPMIDIPQGFGYKMPQYNQYYSHDQQQMPNVMPVVMPNPGTSAHEAQYKIGQGAPSMHAGGQMAIKQVSQDEQKRTRLTRSPLEGEEDKKVPGHELDISTGLTETQKASALVSTNEKDDKLEESHEDSDLLAKAESFLKGNSEAANAEATGAQRLSRSTRRVKRSLEENLDQEPHVVAKRKAQLLDDFEDHNGNRGSFGALGNGLLTPDAEEVGGKNLLLRAHQMLAHYNEQLKKKQPQHNRHSGNSKPNFHLGQFDELINKQKFFKRQFLLEVLGGVFSQDVHLLGSNQKRRHVKELLRQYYSLPLEDQVAQTHKFLHYLGYLVQLAGNELRRQRNAYVDEVIMQESLDHFDTDDKYSKDFMKFVELAKHFKFLEDKMIWDKLAI